jgi:hypothetical protein
MGTQPVPSSTGGKSSAGWIIAVVVIILAAASLIVFRHQVVPGVKSVFARFFHKKPPVEISVQDTVPSPVAEPLPVQQPLPPARKYYIIVASFRNESNADKYVQFLQQKGYESTKIPRTRKNMYAVSCTSYTTQKEALDNLNHYRNTVNARAWVLGY